MGSFVSSPPPLLTTLFESALLPLGTGTGGSVAHGLGVDPTYIRARFVNIVANNNWAVNDDPPMGTGQLGSNASSGLHIWADATNIHYRYGASGVGARMLNKTTGAGFDPSNTNFRLALEAAK